MIRRVARGFLGLVMAVVVGCGPQAVVPSRPPVSSAIATPSSTASAARSGPPATATAPPPSTPKSGVWMVSAAAPMLRPRDGFRALVLGDGSILVAGDDVACAPGPASPGSETAERYDPVADDWSIAASLNNPRKDFAMVPAADGGVMVIGGVNAADRPFSSTKRFDLDAAVWFDGPLQRRAYGDPSAVTVADGRIYVVGPTISDETSTPSTVEILAPGRDHWDEGGRIEGVAVRDVVRLDDGRLVALGWAFELPDQLYVHDSGGAEGWSPLADTGFDTIERIVAIPDGGVLAFGWSYDQATDRTSPLTVRRHDPAIDRWVEIEPMAMPRFAAQIATLADGRVLVAGGLIGPRDHLTESEIARTSEIYDPRSDAWTAGPDLLEIRMGGQALTLPDGSVLVMGGVNLLNVEAATPFCVEHLRSVERLMPAP